MKERTALSRDGCVLQYGYCDQAPGKPWIALIIPFGLQVHVTRAFFELLAADYNIVTWESRLILAPPERIIAPGELTVANHVADLLTVLDACGIERCKLVGYCSGAGIALAAVKATPHRFDDLVLVNGEYTLLKEPSCVTQFAADIDNLLPMASKDRKTAQFILDRIQFDRKLQNGRAPPPGIHLPFSQAHYFHRYAVNYLSYRATNFESLACTVRSRTLVIAGERDLQTNVASSLKIKQSIPGAQMFVETDGDHYELLRQDSTTLGTVRNFLLATEGNQYA